MGMQLIAAWKTVVLGRYAKFDGRAGRAEFWWYALANFIVVALLAILGQVSSIFMVVYALYALAVLIPGIAVAIRRLHDTNRSGWWLLLALIPIVGGIVLIVFCAGVGTPGPNQFAAQPDPYPAMA